MLKQRIITACILIPLTLLILYYATPIIFAGITFAIMLIAAYEWTNLLGRLNTFQRLSYMLLIAILLYASTYINILYILAIALAWWLITFVCILFYPADRRLINFYFRLIAGIFVLIPCWLALNYLFDHSDGFYSILFLFVLIWGADTAAYFVGRAMGKHKLAVQISPGKTWEGALGAFIFAIIYVLAILWLVNLPVKIWHLGVMLACATVFFSIIGDLFESMLKREVGLKDSSQLLPGHGGLLDRIDSLTAAAPIFVLLTILVIDYLEYKF